MDLRQSEGCEAQTAVWWQRAGAALRSLASCIKVRRRERELEVCETLSLGEKRVLMIVRYGRQRLLIGATNQSISLIDRGSVVGPREAAQELVLRKSLVNGAADAL